MTIVRLHQCSPKRWQVVQHSDKTFIGRIERGFDFLGYQFGPSRFSNPNRISQAKTAGRSCPLAPVLRGEG